jgi:hypothetical protein
MYSESSHKTDRTPDPFAELRVFVFLDHKPSIYELKLLKGGLTQIINYTENLFQSIYDAKEANAIIPHDRMEEPYPIRIMPATPRAKMEIDGWEVAKIDFDEVSKFFEEDSNEKLRLNKPYRYCAFADGYGNIEYEYPEKKIQEIERLEAQKQQAQTPP